MGGGRGDRRGDKNTGKNYEGDKTLRHIRHDLAGVLREEHPEKVYRLYIVGRNAAAPYPVP